MAPTSKGDDEEFSIGFLTALVTDELVACEKILSEMKWKPQPVSIVLKDAGISKWAKQIDGRKIIAHAMAIGRMGQAASAIETFAFLERTKPTFTFLTGIAGSLKSDKIFKCDVVVSNHTRWRTQNRVFGEDGCNQYRPYDNLNYDPFVPADMSRRIQKKLVEDFPTKKRGAGDFDRWNAHLGEVYTWDYVLSSKRIVDEINADFPMALCVEMEAGGFLGAISRAKGLRGDRPMQGYVVRGISDYAEGKDKVEKVRTDASRNAALVAVSLAEWMVEKNSILAFKRAAS